ncbi:conserved protein of unknown function [Modestobacter italicus]|uniref:SHOCT domain-containing protein n=1 Tax=Modestobacter italicus (strain DSM 44449 / CECT 9708 / BC 501) TaxID=2732864 RepID=I4F027_MODI5|nr:PH domain-containing protein [Modestobacter marinus]CCH88990.1 conserved protein of unknown function [Modestobacter marinus]
MTEDLRPDIAAAAALLPSTLGSKREIRKLIEHLWEDERVEQLSTGMYGKGNGILVRTDRRLLFLVDGWTGATSEDFPFTRISSVQWSSGMLMGTVTIFASGNKAEIKNVHKEIGKNMVDAVRATISRPAPPIYTAPPVSLSSAPSGGADVFEQLRKLGELRDAGVVTVAEFDAKKAELLARL